MHKSRANRKKNQLLRTAVAAKCGKGLTREQQLILEKNYNNILMKNRGSNAPDPR